MKFRFGETITIHRRTVAGKDAYGDDTFTETNVVLTQVPVVPTTSREVNQGEVMVYDQLTVLLPAGTEISSSDAIEVYGVRYEVQGRPLRFVSPFSGLNLGVPVTLQRVTG